MNGSEGTRKASKGRKAVEDIALYYCSPTEDADRLRILDCRDHDAHDAGLFAKCHLSLDVAEYGRPKGVSVRHADDGEDIACLSTDRGVLELTGDFLSSLRGIPLDGDTVPALWRKAGLPDGRRVDLPCDWGRRNFRFGRPPVMMVGSAML